MYVLQNSPDAPVNLDNGIEVTPVMTLRDEWGGVSHIIRDDGCYVLINRVDQLSNIYRMSCHWYNEAVDALIGFVGVDRPSA